MKRYFAVILMLIDGKNANKFQSVTLKAINPKIGYAIANAYLETLHTEYPTGKDGQKLTYEIDSFVEYIELN